MWALTAKPYFDKLPVSLRDFHDWNELGAICCVALLQCLNHILEPLELWGVLCVDVSETVPTPPCWRIELSRDISVLPACQPPLPLSS